MNTANLDLCKQLWEVSGWVGTEHNYPGEKLSNRTAGTKDDPHIMSVIPAYDLGYLLRKLPDATAIVYTKKGSIAHFGYRDKEDTYHALDPTSDTPEDAAVKLCLVLFEQNILTKEAA